MSVQNEFFTWQSLATFSGTTMATTAVTNAVCKVVPSFRHPAPLGLSLALLLCIVTSIIDPSSGSLDFGRPFATYFIATINGFFVFASAAGLSSGASAATRGGSARRATRRGHDDTGTKPEEVALKGERPFWQDWF